MKILISILFLALASLACMTSAATIDDIAKNSELVQQLAPTQTAIAAAPGASASEPAAGAVFDLQNCVRDSSHAQFCRPTPSPLCARVTAIQSLHLRDQPNQRARVLAYLKNGEQVRVIAFGPWWKIQTARGEGYANAKYLKLTECQP